MKSTSMDSLVCRKRWRALFESSCLSCNTWERKTASSFAWEKYKLPSSQIFVSPALQTVSPRGRASGEGRGRLHTGGTSGKGAGRGVSQSHLKDGVQLVEALQAPHSLASAAGEGVVSGWEVNGELVPSSRQRSNRHSRVFFLTFTKRIHNLNGVNLVIFSSNIYNCPSVSDVQEHLEASAVDGTHLLREDQLSLATLYCSHSNVFLLLHCIPSSSMFRTAIQQSNPHKSPKYNEIAQTATDWRQKQLWPHSHPFVDTLVFKTTERCLVE